jgi:ABC-type transporter Mla MlaB component
MSLHTNYSQLYADASKNPFGMGEGRKIGMGHYINEWRSGNAPLDLMALTTSVLDQFTDHPVGGIGIFVTDNNNDLRLQVLLGLRKYTRNPSDLHSILFNQSFVYVNDVMEGIGSIVGFDSSMLEVTADINVHTLNHHRTLLNDDEALELIGPIADNAVQSETIKTRKAMYIPYELVHYMLGKNLSPRQAFMVLFPVMEAAGLLTVCKPLVDFLRVAGTLPTGGTTPPLVAHDKAGRAIIAEIGLMLFMKIQVLLRDLEGLKPMPITTDPVIRQLTAAVDTMTQNQLKRDEANERALLAKDKKKSIRDVYSDGKLNRLANIIHIDVADLDLLPDVYNSIAASRKENALAVVQQKIDDLALIYGLSDGPILPTSSIQYFKTLRFQGIDARDVSSGLLPMTFTPPGAMSVGARAVALENNVNIVSYELMMGGTHQLTSSDAKELAKSKAYVTTDWSEAKAQVESYQPVLATILGRSHATTKAYVAAVKYSSRVFLELKEALNVKVGYKKGPSMFVYIFQAHFGGWFREQFVSEDIVPAPNLVAMF